MESTGWRGRYFEDFDVGDVFVHPLGRTITQSDNIWFTLLTQNTAAIHFDAVYAARTEFGRPLVNSALTLAIVTGQSVTDISQNVFANLAWEAVKMPHPLLEGDTLYSKSEVVSLRESRSRPNLGVVTVTTTGFNQDAVTVISYQRTMLVYKRGGGPERPQDDLAKRLT